MNGFELPISKEKDNEYVIDLHQKLGEYINYITTVKGIPECVIKQTEDNITRIQNSLKFYYNADIHSAKQNIGEILVKYKSDAFIVSTLDNNYAFRGIAPFKDLHSERYDDLYKSMTEYPLSFFKARIDGSGFTRKHMLHIPFDKREIISTQRFSIPGVPCVYLGTTSYVCWLELGNPADHNFNVSLYSIPGDLKILNLAISEGLINGITSGYKQNNTINTIIEIWPLICAISYSISEENRKFKSEYIVSQLLMQCLNELKIDGVAYISKKARNDLIAYPQCVNLALPIKYNGNFMYKQVSDKYGQLCNSFELTEPINFSEYLKMPIYCPEQMEGTFINNFYKGNNYSHFIDLAGKKPQYVKTTFAAFDNYLFNLPREKVKWEE